MYHKTLNAISDALDRVAEAIETPIESGNTINTSENDFS
jgi:hypothetical protein